MNKLYFGDNLDILRQLNEEYPKGFIDLIYIDPPFNSKRNYNVLFESVELTDTTAQKEAFADTWSNVSYLDSLDQLAELNINLYNFIRNLENTGISISAISYLTTMAIRLYYFHKLLNDTGSFFLHCDPTMSHYLKVLCDIIFGEKNFKNEIIWHYRRWTNVQNQFQQMHDVILFYSKTKKNTFNFTEVDMSESQKKKFHRGWDSNVIHNDKERYAQLIVYSKEKLEVAIKSGRMDTSKYKNIIYRDNPVVAASDVILMPALNSQAKERLGYPTQKPEQLLEILIESCSNKDDLVADFFCGCGTSIAVAEKLQRKWLGVDISHLAIRLIANRIGKDKLNKTYEIHGFPQDLDSAKELANNVKGGRLEFEEWIVEYMLHGILNEKRNEMGFDGYRTFNDGKQRHIVMIEVKSGNVTMAYFNHFIRIVEERGGSIGIFVCFKDQITKNMLLTAKKQDKFLLNDAPWADKIQIITVEELLKGIMPRIPESIIETFKKAEKISKHKDTQTKMDI